MNCCINCFKDEHLRNTIIKNDIKGNCDFCASKDIPIIDISVPNDISDMIVSLVQAYTVSDMSEAKLLKESLRDDWDIFNSGAEMIQTLVKALCIGIIDKDDKLFSEKVVIPQKYDDDFLQSYGVVRGLTWNQFSEYIKYENRFHNDKFNPEILASFLSIALKIYKKDESFFRARIAKDKVGYSAEYMGQPPRGKRAAGRVNPEEIAVLYLSGDPKTVLYETRATVYDYVSIGEFKAIRDLRLIDLSAIAQISPFLYAEDIEKFAVNRKVFQEMSQEIAKPMRRNDSSLEYLPTQFISEFVKSQGYDGVGFESTINKGGYNYALFDENLVECVGVNTVEISKINYETK